MIWVHRSYRFNASHRLHVAELDEKANQELFGKCNNPYGHGHNYELEVTIAGEVDARTGQAVDLKQLDGLVERVVIQRYDHRYLSEELPEFQKSVATTENLGIEVFRRLSDEWRFEFPTGEPRLDSVRIFETSRNIVKVEAGTAA